MGRVLHHAVDAGVVVLGDDDAERPLHRRLIGDAAGGERDQAGVLALDGGEALDRPDLRRLQEAREPRDPLVDERARALPGPGPGGGWRRRRGPPAGTAGCRPSGTSATSPRNRRSCSCLPRPVAGILREVRLELTIPATWTVVNATGRIFRVAPDVVVEVYPL